MFPVPVKVIDNVEGAVQHKVFKQRLKQSVRVTQN